MKRAILTLSDSLHAQAKAAADRLEMTVPTYIRTVLANELRPAPKVAATSSTKKGPNTSPAGAVRFFGPMEVGAAGAFRRSRGEEAVAHFAKIKQSLAEYGLSAQANYVYPAWSPAAEDIIDADLLVSDYDVEYPFDTVDDGVAFDLVLQAVEAGAVPESIPAHLIFE